MSFVSCSDNAAQVDASLPKNSGDQKSDGLDVLEDEPQPTSAMFVTLKTSDARVTFIDVVSPWKDLQPNGLDTAELTYQVSSDDHGFECEIEYLRLFTSNKAVIVPSGNICENSVLEIDIDWPNYKGEPIELKEAGFRWGLNTVPPTEEFPFAVDVLSYSLPETDEIVMSLQCTRGSRLIQLTFESAAVNTNPVANAPRIDLISNDNTDPYLYRFASKWVHFDMADGVISAPAVHEHIDHPFFSEFEKNASFDLHVEGSDMQIARIDTNADAGILKEYSGRCAGDK